MSLLRLPGWLGFAHGMFLMAAALEYTIILRLGCNEMTAQLCAYETIHDLAKVFWSHILSAYTHIV